MSINLTSDDLTGLSRLLDALAKVGADVGVCVAFDAPALVRRDGWPHSLEVSGSIGPDGAFRYTLDVGSA